MWAGFRPGPDEREGERYEHLDDITLKSGRDGEDGRGGGVGADWAERIDEDLLGHKGPVCQWANRTVLREDPDMEAYF